MTWNYVILSKYLIGLAVGPGEPWQRPGNHKYQVCYLRWAEARTGRRHRQ